MPTAKCYQTKAVHITMTAFRGEETLDVGLIPPETMSIAIFAMTVVKIYTVEMSCRMTNCLPSLKYWINPVR